MKAYGSNSMKSQSSSSAGGGGALAGSAPRGAGADSADGRDAVWLGGRWGGGELG